MTPRGRRHLRAAALAGALVTGLLSMHGVATASAGPGALEHRAQSMTAPMPDPVSAHQPAHRPAEPAHHPASVGHATCVSTPAYDEALVVPPALVGRAAGVAPDEPGLSRELVPSRSDRAPPDLDRLCISRT